MLLEVHLVRVHLRLFAWYVRNQYYEMLCWSNLESLLWTSNSLMKLMVSHWPKERFSSARAFYQLGTLQVSSSKRGSGNAQVSRRFCLTRVARRRGNFDSVSRFPNGSNGGRRSSFKVPAGKVTESSVIEPWPTQQRKPAAQFLQ